MIVNGYIIPIMLITVIIAVGTIIAIATTMQIILIIFLLNIFNNLRFRSAFRLKLIHYS